MNNKFLLALLLLLSATLSFTQTATPHIPNQVIIGFSDDATQAEKQLLIDEMGTLMSGLITTPSGSTIDQQVLMFVDDYPVTVGNQSYSSDIDLISTIQGQHAKVDHADFNYSLTTEQYSFSTFMGNTNMSEFSPIPEDCEANYPGGALEAQLQLSSNALVKVGILDTGLDPYYPIINQYIAAEINVLTDDEDPEGDITISYGYDPTHPIARDDNGHGTAVAGIIAGLSDRANISPANLEIYIIKCFDSQGDGDMFNMLQAIRVAQTLELDLVNLSWSYLPVPQDQYASVLEDALQKFGNKDNAIIVAGAGNDSQDLANQAYAPAAITGIANLITVAGVAGEERNCSGALALFSNFGNAANIAAPSSSISVPGLNGFWALNTSGTSFSAPIVTAAVIQSWIAHEGNFEEPSVYGEIHPICNMVLKTATEVFSLTGLGIEGVVNFQAAADTTDILSLQADNFSRTTATARLDQSKNQPVIEGLVVSPNPFTNHLMITLDGAQHTAVQLQISTLQGAVILEKAANSREGETIHLDLPTHLPAGPYLLRVNQDGQIHTRMIVKN